METSGGIRASLAGRYASALFDLARDQRQIEAVGKSLDALNQALVDSKDFAELIASPLVSRERSRQGVRSACAAAQARPDHYQFPRRPRPQRPQERSSASIIRAFRRLAADHRGETTAEVVTAHPLNDDQLAALRQQLRTRAGRDVTIDATVDPDILGGLVVKLGSQLIDASIRTKLNRLASAMKG